MAVIAVVETQKRNRRFFTPEFKFSLIEWYYNNGKNILLIANKFKVDRKQISNWITGKENIRKPKSKSKNVRGRKAQYPLLEEELFLTNLQVTKSWEQYIKMVCFYQKQRKSCWKNTHLWLIFNYLMRFVGETNYHFIERLMFLRRLRHSLNLQSGIFTWSCYEKGNMGHLHCSTFPIWIRHSCRFVLDDGRTYDAKGSEEVWFSSGKSGLDKRQITIQLTVFANRIPRVRPTIIFWAKGKRSKASEIGSWDN